MKKINQVVFTLISTSWVWVVYGIKQKWTLPHNCFLFTAIALIFVPLLLTLIWLLVAEACFSKDNIEGGCQDVEEAQNDFLADYLGYFFIGVEIEDYKILLMIYIIIFIFTFVSQSKLFNPLLLIFGYKYYSLTTVKGTKVFLISRKSLRSSNDIELNKLRRINNMSYIDVGR